MLTDKKILSRSTIKLIMLFWVVFTTLAAFFIPQYDFSLDGVKIWLLFSGLILLTLFAVTISLSMLKV